MSLERLRVKSGGSVEKEAVAAVAELKTKIHQADAAAAIVFCSSKYDLQKLGAELKKSFPYPVVGCTTSGEISDAGYSEFSISGVTLASPELRLENKLIDGLDAFTMSRAEEFGHAVNTEVAEYKARHKGGGSFGLFLIDGLSMMEEQVVGRLNAALKGLPVIGGSAGDDLTFKATYVYHDGKFMSNAATLALFNTTLPFKTFKSQHFQPSDDIMVITGAEPEKRIVREINGKPAAWEYARLVGLDIKQLQPQVFSKYPVMLKIAGEYYVRSIQKVNDDGSLTFFCAIDEGLVLTIAKGVDYLTTLKGALDKLRSEVPRMKVVLGCECILRRLEVIDKELVAEASAVMKEHNVIGFHTYGEQFNALHINQTLTGVGIGE